ncbi:MAG: acyltransferase domain-containing protein, partial [Desulfuromonadales bacterium]|nr:acyltransferase domain-containing protein [Desulfuromonadales bacterium]MBN2793167.1 acyltransferase domain-containing protein [Desulfuromonadales bacterium]
MKNNGAESGQSEQLHATPLAIIGIGCMYPQADNAGQFWTNIKNATDAISEVPETHWRAEDYYDQDPKSADKVYAKLGGFLSPVTFNPMDYGILPNAIEAIDTSQLLGLLTVDQALKDAGYSSEREFDRDKVSVILGVTGALELVIPLGARLGYPRWKEALTDAGVDERLAEDVMQRISDSYVPWQENSFPGLLGNVVAGRISKHFNLGGTNCVVDAACGSSLSALNLAALELAAGRSDMVITGGVDTFNDIFMYTCFSKTPALSPTGHARPYDADSDGTTLGEGLGVVVIKRLADAERDGDKIYAVVRGIGASSDGRGAAIYEPDAKGQAKALKRAYEQAGVTPDSIELLEGHGTGTKVGDAIELSALHEVFGEAQQPWCALGSIKSQIGHTKAAAGAAGLIKAALALYHKTLPPTIKVTKPQDSLCSATTPFYVNSQTRPWIAKPDHPRRAGISALGFGGSNFHCLLEEHRSAKAEVDWNEDVQLLPFSAASREELQRKLNTFPQDVTAKELRRLARQQRDGFDPSAEFRLVLSIENSVSAVKQLAKALTLLDKHQESDSWDTPDGIFFGRGQLQGRLAMLFPGQGAQYPGMLSDLALQFPEFLATVEDADRAVARTGGLAAGTLAKAIYPQPVFSEALRKEQAVQLQATELAQPSLGTVSLAGARVLARFGVVPEAVAGHSYGELTALCAAEVVTTDDLFVLSRLRGELMASGHGDRGSMLAVSAPLEQIEKFLEEEQLDLVLANRNTPTQGVLSGSTVAIEKARDLLTEKGLACKQLDVSAAFHSRLVADAAQPFAERLEQITFNTPRKEVFSNTTGEAYPVTGEAVRELFAQQLASPVDFISEIENLYAAGVRIFLEVGPGARLSGMVKAILPQDDVHVLALDSSSGRRSNIVDLAYVLGRLSALGASVALKHWDSDFILDEPEKTGKKPGIKVTLCGANHYQQPPKRKPLNIEPAPNSSVQQTLPAAAPRTVETMNKATTDQQDPSSRNILAALKITQQSLQALQDLQQQTAKLHQQFLEGQQTATQTFMTLVHQQQQLLQGNSIAPSGGQPVSLSSAQPAPAATVERSAVSDSQVTATVNSVSDGSGLDHQQPEPVGTSVDSAPLLLAIIAEKTGYPVEMLELDMALDSDLGIDSIKR